MSFNYLVLIAFWTVLLAELVGDKSLYAVASLSLRFRSVAVFAGIVAAFAAKALAAVLLAQVLIQLHTRWTDVLSALAFFVSAFFVWVREPDQPAGGLTSERGWLRPVLISFVSLFLTEWGDPGQIALAALTMKTHAPFAVWMGGTLAMATKGALAITLGLALRDRLPMRALRTIASVSCCVLGCLALFGSVAR